uniref:Putative secreted protein n=1 Tax=Ixodes ricinus TaxID=34613 RepID=A0A6B0TQJ7_IXORI
MKHLRCCAFLCVLFLRHVFDDVLLSPSFGHNATAFSRNKTSKTFTLKKCIFITEQRRIIIYLNASN